MRSSKTIRKIFLHGWATDKRVWKCQLKSFGNSSALNLPGHGNEKNWDEPTLKPAVDMVLDSIKKGPVIGIGWSLGAEVLMEAITLMPDKFVALIVTGGTPSFVEREDFPWGQKKSLVKKMLADFKKSPRDTLKRFYALNFTGHELKKDGARNFLKLYGKSKGFDFEGIKEALSSLISADLREKLPEMDIPTLIIHGGRDSVCPAGAARYLKKNIKGARLEIFRDAGHAPFVTEPKRFNRCVMKFLERL